MTRFEWDENKNTINKAKHGIGFEVAEFVFDDPGHVSLINGYVDGEERWTAIGAIEDIIVLAEVHTYREEPSDEVIRIINARRATRDERRLYEQANR
jgi:uncharacterized DUF497 family protein